MLFSPPALSPLALFHHDTAGPQRFTSPMSMWLHETLRKQAVPIHMSKLLCFNFLSESREASAFEFHRSRAVNRWASRTTGDGEIFNIGYCGSLTSVIISIWFFSVERGVPSRDHSPSSYAWIQTISLRVVNVKRHHHGRLYSNIAARQLSHWPGATWPLKLCLILLVSLRIYISLWSRLDWSSYRSLPMSVGLVRGIWCDSPSHPTAYIRSTYAFLLNLAPTFRGLWLSCPTAPWGQWNWIRPPWNLVQANLRSAPLCTCRSLQSLTPRINFETFGWYWRMITVSTSDFSLP